VPDLRLAPLLLILLLTLLGFGFGLTFTVHMVSVQSAVEWEQRGSSVASNNFLRQMGQVIGITLLGYLLTNRIHAFQSSHGDASVATVDLNELFSPHSGQALPVESVEWMQGSLQAGLQPIFVVLAVLSVLSLLVVLCYPRKGSSNRNA
jgi:MFS family permease